MNDIWRSERLAYRAFEAPTDDEFWRSSLAEPEVFVNGIDFLPRPWSAEELIGMRKRLIENALIFVIICKIPGSNVVSAEEDDKTATSNTQKKKPKPVPIGMVNLSGPSSPHVAHHRSAMMGIFIANEYQGHGYGPEAIKWIVEWAFKKAGLHRVGLEVYGYNTKALKIYGDLGFVNEGGARDDLWYDGKWWDKVYMGILADEWEKLQEKSSV